MKPRVFVIDDAISVRALIGEALHAFSVEVVGTSPFSRHTRKTGRYTTS